MVEGHLNQGNFDSEVIKLGSKLVDASIELHRHVMNNFLPSAVKFHYQFNLRELSNITQVCPPRAAVFDICEGRETCHGNHICFMHHTGCSKKTCAGSSPSAPFVLHRRACAFADFIMSIVVQGLLRMNKDYYREPVKVVRLWVHECERVLADRMINDTDMTKFNEFRVTVTKKYFDDVNQVNTGSLYRPAVLSYCCNQPCLSSHYLCCEHAEFSQVLHAGHCMHRTSCTQTPHTLLWH